VTELTYCNGEIRSGQELSISVLDAGFVQGVTVSEQLRTFGGKLFALDEHFARLRRSLEVVGLQDIDLDNLRAEAGVIASHNHSLQQPGDDIGLTIFVTPGSPPVLKRSVEAERSVGMSTTPLPFHRWADNYANGVSLVVTSVRQVPANCWPPELKCRSRMHYFLADREAQNARPGARALLLDQEGFIAEASTASVLVYREAEGFVAPRPEKVLPSISVGMLRKLAETLEIDCIHRDITIDDVRSANEVLLMSTSPCLLPVTSIDGDNIGSGEPGPVFTKLLAAWSSHVETDIVGQARQFAYRG
jgi:branched-chain amino acid aminotransferase